MCANWSEVLGAGVRVCARVDQHRRSLRRGNDDRDARPQDDPAADGCGGATPRALLPCSPRRRPPLRRRRRRPSRRGRATSQASRGRPRRASPACRSPRRRRRARDRADRAPAARRGRARSRRRPRRRRPRRSRPARGRRRVRRPRRGPPCAGLRSGRPERPDLVPAIRLARRAGAVRLLRRAAVLAGRDARRGDRVLRAALVAAGLRGLALRDGHERPPW